MERTRLTVQCKLLLMCGCFYIIDLASYWCRLRRGDCFAFETNGNASAKNREGYGDNTVEHDLIRYQVETVSNSNEPVSPTYIWYTTVSPLTQ